MKTVRFGSPTYVGDPINTVRLFNEKEVDELIVLDIDATSKAAEPNYQLIRHIAAECRMPLCYGGGVSTTEHFERLVGLGVEKVAMSSAVVKHPGLVSEAAARVGSQSVVIVIDVIQTPKGYRVSIHNSKQSTDLNPVAVAKQMEQLGAGEIVLNSVDRDGMMSGYDLELVESIRGSTTLPLTVLGGAGSLAHIAEAYERFGTIGAAAGSLFVFKGAYKAVLVNYPTRVEKDALFLSALKGPTRAAL